MTDMKNIAKNLQIRGLQHINDIESISTVTPALTAQQQQ